MICSKGKKSEKSVRESAFINRIRSSTNQHIRKKKKLHCELLGFMLVNLFKIVIVFAYFHIACADIVNCDTSENYHLPVSHVLVAFAGENYWPQLGCPFGFFTFQTTVRLTNSCTPVPCSATDSTPAVYIKGINCTKENCQTFSMSFHSNCNSTYKMWGCSYYALGGMCNNYQTIQQYEKKGKVFLRLAGL